MLKPASHAPWLMALVASLLTLWVTLPTLEAETPRPLAATPEEIQSELPRQLRELDSPYYENRRRAAVRLESWVGQAELGDVLGEAFQRCLLQPDLSTEVRWRIEGWQDRLPARHIEPPQSQSAAELQRLISQLDDNSYAIRVGACARLKWLAGSERFASPILHLLRERLADPALGEDTFRRIEEVRSIAWASWFENDPGDRGLPPTSSKQIEGWLDELADGGKGNQGVPEPTASSHAKTGAAPPAPAWLRRAIARQSLMDALARDADVPRIKAAMEARLRGNPDPKAAAVLHELLDMTQPAIVAEVWINREMQHPEQRMIIGQAKRFTETANPSCFDRTDDRVAHCASGNSLVPGDYPVGIAFAAPRWNQGDREGVFHLVNLPSPRRQVAYNYYAKTDAAARLTKLSRRTLDRFLAEKTLLNDPQLGLLAQLDAGEVSRFAGRYFFLVEDGTVGEEVDAEYSTSRRHLGVESSRFGSICAQLAIDGTRQALPGLVDAIRQKRFLSPTPLAPYRMEWLAALSIAQRDPWPGVDAWLAENLENRQALDISRSDAADIGATAAALLLERHHLEPREFGLQRVVDPHLWDMKVNGYTFVSADDAQLVRKWWSRQAESGKKAAADW